jgi:hypothetical protein
MAQQLWHLCMSWHLPPSRHKGIDSLVQVLEPRVVQQLQQRKGQFSL